MINLASNGSSFANSDPKKSIKRIILHQKPNIAEACKPDLIYHNNSVWAPKLAKKLIEIEDIVAEK